MLILQENIEIGEENGGSRIDGSHMVHTHVSLSV